MSDAKDQAIAFNVRLKPSESSAHLRDTNYTNLGMAQGITHVDLGFIDPTLLTAIAKTAKDGQAVSKGLHGHLIIHVSMNISAWRAYSSRLNTSCSTCAIHGSQG